MYFNGCLVYLIILVSCLINNDVHCFENKKNALETKMHDHHCKHEHPKIDEIVQGVHIEPPHVVKKRSVSQPFRISIFYDHSVYRLDAEKFDMINNTILPEAVQFWERTLRVRKTGGPIKLNRKCPTRQVFLKDDGRTHCIDTCLRETVCGEIQVPQIHLNPCYVCNSTGLNCHAMTLKEMYDRGLYDPDQDYDDGNSTTTDGNYETTTVDGVADEGQKSTSAFPNINWDEVPEPSGVSNTDFVLYVSAIETERCRRGMTIAYAAHCQQESALDRPVAGHANFCPSELSTHHADLSTMLSAVKHEMLHALGFSVSLFAFYRDDKGNPLTDRRPDTGSPPLNEELQVHQWSDRVVRNITRPKWVVRGGYMPRTFNVIVTPKVVKEVRKHFNCPTLDGAELEDQGGEGTALTHWEKRLFENEAMTGTHTQSSVFSRITLALLEDTGWYKVDYSVAEPLEWGKDLGCKFATASCKEWLSINHLRRKNPSPLCTRIKADPLRTECSLHRDAVTLCNLAFHENALPAMYQHFDSLPDVPASSLAHYGGSVSLADYCPYLQEFSWKHKDQILRGSRCSIKDNTPRTDMNFALENYGKNSKCFEHSDHAWEQRSCKQIREWQHWGSGCYKYKCEQGRLHIIVGNYTYTCYHASQILRIRIIRSGWLHKGGVMCPPCNEICGKEFQSRGEFCKGGEEAPPPIVYKMDELHCAGAIGKPSHLLLYICSFVIISLANFRLCS